MKIKSPIMRYSNESIYTTLPYGSTRFVNQYKQLGWNLTHHNGIDLVNSTNSQRAYGSPVLASQDGVIQRVIYTTSLSAQGNGVIVEGLPFIKDDKKMMLCEIHWHLADVVVNAGDFVKQGQIIGHLGNSGFVVGGNRLPFAGTHNHFMIYPYIEINGRWQKTEPNNGVNGAVNPELWFEDDWKNKAPIYNPTWIEHSWTITKIIEKSINAIKKLFNK